MPNLLPILRLRPKRVYSLTSDSTADRSAKIVSAAAKAGTFFENENIRLSPMPTLQETSRAVLRAVHSARESGLVPLLNFTGGTKLMSIGAFQVAAQEAIPSFYLNTRDECLDDGNTAPDLARLAGGDLSIASVAESLNLDIMVAANGHKSVSSGRHWQPFFPAAAWLQKHPIEANALARTFSGKTGFFGPQGEPRKPEGWLPWFERPFSIPEGLLERLPHEVVRKAAPNQALLPDTTLSSLQTLASGEYVENFKERYFEAIAPVQASLAFLGGAWFEVIVADAMHRAGRFRDVRWSAKVEQQSGAELEEDLLALDGLQTVCVSCKSSAEKSRTLPHLEELHARVNAIGGRMNRCYLAVPDFRDPSGHIRSRAKTLGIRILTTADLDTATPFAQ